MSSSGRPQTVLDQVDVQKALSRGASLVDRLHQPGTAVRRGW